MDREMELAHLRLITAHIGEGEQRVASQAALLERLRAEKYDSTEAERLLQLLLQTLIEWKRLRNFIVAELASSHSDHIAEP